VCGCELESVGHDAVHSRWEIPATARGALPETMGATAVTRVLPRSGRREAATVVRHLVAARRVRLEVPELYGAPELAPRVEAELRRLRGVRRVTADPRSGRVLIEYAAGAPFLRRLRALPAPLAARPPADTGAAPRLLARLWPAPVARQTAGPDGVPPWHGLDVPDVLRRLGSSEHGLSSAQALQRQREHGPNALEADAGRSRWEILASQFANLPTVLLAGSSALSAGLRDFLDAGAILAVIGLNAGVGFEIERTNEDLLASWRRLEAGEALVVRDGLLKSVATADVAVGDVLLCRSGDTIAADARVIETHRLTCDEAALTGESEPQRKGTGAVHAAAVLAERSSMLYAGTVVVSGHGRAVVTAIGRHTEVARVRQLVEVQDAPRTPLQRRLDDLGRWLTGASVVAGGAAAVLGLARGLGLGRAARNAVSLGVAAIPEGLPVVSTAALVQSMRRMRRRGMVVRRLASAETLGGVTVVCADKTGTLTCNEMRLEVLDLGGGPLDPAAIRARAEAPFSDGPTLALAAGVLNSDVDVQANGSETAVHGSSTERALVTAAEAAGLRRPALRHAFPRRMLRERDSGVHFVVSLHDVAVAGLGFPAVAFVKGAPEQVLELCTHDLAGRLTAARRRRLLQRNDAMANAGLRVLALGWRPQARPDTPVLDRGYTLVGLAGLRDPLRMGAADAVRAAADAGIRTVILTGDQRRTAEAIARAVGLRGTTVEGPDVPRMLKGSAADVARRLAQVAVFARVTPADKVAILEALRTAGDIVAMAGDGVNDAPALKAADVGIAIGIRSSDVARQAADVVLENEDLRSILSAVGEGRVVQDNLRRALRFLLATNLSEAVVVLTAAALGLGEPLRPLQLLWINLITDTWPAMALALEPAWSDVLDRPPAPPDAPLLGPGMLQAVARDGALLAAMGGVGYALGGPAMAFSTLMGAQLGYTGVCRSPEAAPDSRFLALVGTAVGLQVATLAVPPLRLLLGLPALATAGEVAGFAAGLAVPWVGRLLADGVEVVRFPQRARRADGREPRSAGRGRRQVSAVRRASRVPKRARVGQRRVRA